DRGTGRHLDDTLTTQTFCGEALVRLLLRDVLLATARTAVGEHSCFPPSSGASRRGVMYRGFFRGAMKSNNIHGNHPRRSLARHRIFPSARSESGAWGLR